MLHDGIVKWKPISQNARKTNTDSLPVREHVPELLGHQYTRSGSHNSVDRCQKEGGRLRENRTGFCDDDGIIMPRLAVNDSDLLRAPSERVPKRSKETECRVSGMCGVGRRSQESLGTPGYPKSLPEEPQCPSKFKLTAIFGAFELYLQEQLSHRSHYDIVIIIALLRMHADARG
ncbi:hypothetical protein FIBSPDRAFT_941242 [Athelia psychrophila]|uniref:Uncharacterized protein n=1 Tax=Athelia psychrophila TaxID=1759441 RepID=A0A167UHW8_9AGAM|nr:hypothetical protein FIBSPDRAFT_941242 [Fibularhizoctonia sp. CBS 109695]